MKKTALGCTILEGHDVADLPLVSENAEILELELAKKVDKATGKGLSTNDYTTAEKNKLSGIATGAEKNTVTSVAGKTGAVSVTKSDVGLGSVLNYGIATKAQAEAGASNALYMTPIRVKEAIESLSSSLITGTVSISSQNGVYNMELGFKPRALELHVLHKAASPLHMFKMWAIPGLTLGMNYHSPIDKTLIEPYADSTMSGNMGDIDMITYSDLHSLELTATGFELANVDNITMIHYWAWK